MASRTGWLADTTTITKEEDDVSLADIGQPGVASPFRQHRDTILGGRFASNRAKYFVDVMPIAGQTACEMARSTVEGSELALDAAAYAVKEWLPGENEAIPAIGRDNELGRNMKMQHRGVFEAFVNIWVDHQR